MNNQTYKLNQTGEDVKRTLEKVPKLETASSKMQQDIQSLQQNMPTKTSDLKNDVGFVTANELKEVEAIAKGRASGYVFDTVDDMNTWLENIDNVAQLNLGDNLYIRTTDVPDYWWDGYQAQELETQKVDLSEYATFDDVAKREDLSNKVQTIVYIGDDDKTYPTSSAVFDLVLTEGHRIQNETIDIHITPLKENIENIQEEIKSTAYRLIRRLIVEEDVSSVIISKDEEGNSFKLTDFEVRFSGSATTTQWYSIGQGEKYSSLNGTLNNGGLPFWNAGGYKNTYVKYVYSDANYYGFAFEQIHTSSASAGVIKPFDTTKCSKATSVIVQAISGGVLNSGSVIEVWGY